MKFRVDPLPTLGVMALVGTIIAGGVLTYRQLSPAPIRFEAVTVTGAVQAGSRFDLDVEAKRRDAGDCTNGVQIDLKGQGDVITRLPVPTREIDGDVSTYIIDLPETIAPGLYGIKVRETFHCGTRPKVAESLWIALEVVG